MADPVAGTIYDIGYQRYEGVRLGRRHAVWALYVHSLRSVFGIGRSLSSKVGPMGLGVIAFLPAVIQVGVAAIAPADVEITRPEEYYELFEIVLAVFCAVVAPELVGRDQRTHTLSLYFSRALRRQDYAIAKFAALTTGMLAITAAPQVMMFVGNGLAADNFFDYLQDEWTDLPSIAGSAVMLSGLVAGIGLVIAAQVPGRAFSTVGIIAAFVLTSIIAGSVFEAADKDVGRYALLLSPFHVARGLSLWFFSAFPGGNEELAEADLPAVTFVIAAALASVSMLLLLLRRYQRISP